MKQTKRLIALLLCLILCAAMLPGVSSADAVSAPTVTVCAVTAEAGADVALEVQLSENPGLMAMIFEIGYDHALLTLTGVADAGLTGWERNADKILWLGEADSSYTGTILTLNFRVADTAGPGDVPVTLSCEAGDVGNHDEQSFTPQFIAGGVHIHGWDVPTYTWAEDNSTVTASRVCTVNAAHTETETVNTASEVTKEATYDEEGEITYTAQFTNPAFETQTKAVATPKLEKPILSNPFVDVKPGAFYYDAVLWAVNAAPQITSGTSATTFSPNNTCTRGQVVTFLWRAKGCPEPTLTTNPFTDVASGKFYYKAVLWAVENGVTSGLNATTFGPDSPCTRGQVVTFLWRTVGKPEPASLETPFTDVSSTGFYYKSMCWAVENGVTTGTSKTTFAPGKPCTRGQIVTFLYRTFGP